MHVRDQYFDNCYVSCGLCHWVQNKHLKSPTCRKCGLMFFIFNQNIHVIKNYSESHYRTFDSDSRCIQVHFVNSELYLNGHKGYLKQES